jgi:hypothetical protein
VLLAGVLALALASSPAGETISETAARVVSQSNTEKAVVVPVEKIADDVVKDVVWIVRSHAFDLGTTALVIRNGGTELNPLGPDVESRIALKMFGSASGALACWEFRRAGKHRTANIFRWVTVGANVAFGMSNLYQAFKD